jgi:hypothetical protein
MHITLNVSVMSMITVQTYLSILCGCGMWSLPWWKKYFEKIAKQYIQQAGIVQQYSTGD